MHAQLYLSRARTCPLVIDLDMRTPYIQPIRRRDAKKQAGRALETLQFIIDCGGTIDRWSALIILSKIPQTIFDIIRLINLASTPVLHFLSLRWKGHPDVAHIDEEDAMENAMGRGILGDSCSLSHGPKRPQLCQVELNGLPAAFVFNRGAPLASNLTKLTLVRSSFLPSIPGISALLSASPRLESLCVNTTGMYWEYEPEHEHLETLITLAPLQVQLPWLRSLSLDIEYETAQKWGLQLLQIVDAPGLEYFELAVGREDLEFVDDRAARRLFRYLGTGRLNGALLCNISLRNEHPGGEAIFPLLRHLNAQRVICRPSAARLFLKAFPMVTKATLNVDCLQSLVDHPQLLPNTSHFIYNDMCTVTSEYMLKVISSRTKRGMGNVSLEFLSPMSEAWQPSAKPQPWMGESDNLYKQYILPLRRVTNAFITHDSKPEFENNYVYDSDDGSISMAMANSDEDSEEEA